MHHFEDPGFKSDVSKGGQKSILCMYVRSRSEMEVIIKSVQRSNHTFIVTINSKILFIQAGQTYM